MTKALIRLFIKNPEDTSNPRVRGKYGLLAGLAGIVSNGLLFALKLTVGTLFNSIAITADAVNNLSDAGSSLITLIGFKLSGKPADDEHPYGHARIEYITGFVVSLMILLLGIELVKSSFDKIIHPEPVEFNYLTVAVLVIAIAMKLWQSQFNKNLGKRIHSTTLEATSKDSLNDVIATSAVLAALLVGHFSGLLIDGYMGILVALFILYSGVGLMKETINPLLGQAPDPEWVKALQDRILSYPGVIGLHDLVLHNYGPDRYFATVHVEVPAEHNLLDSHDIIDTIEKELSREFHIQLVIHMDPVVTADEKINQLRAEVKGIVNTINSALSMHDFRVVSGKTHCNLIFEVRIPSSVKLSDKELREKIAKEITGLNENYHTVLTLDRNFVSSME